MIQELKFKNFMSFRDEVTLSFEATKDKTFEDYEGESTRFALINSTDWHSDILKRYPKAEISYYGSFVDEFNAVESGAVDVALGFTNFSDQIMASYPDLAFIKDPFEVIQYGFGTHNTEKGRALQDSAKDIPLSVAGCVDLPPEKAKMLHELLYELLDGRRCK